jgi:hypothetical protein
VPRPNGELYFPRRLAGGTDIDVLRRLREKHIPVLLYGPPGTGKTAMVEAAYPDLLTVAGTGDTIVEDFLGNFIPLPDGTYEFVYGPLVQAMREGRALLVDDATLIPPKVLAVLYPAMDGRRTGSTSSPGTTPACTARSSPKRWRRGSTCTSRSPPTSTSPAISASPPPPSPPPKPSTTIWPPAGSPGHPSCASCSASPASARPWA